MQHSCSHSNAICNQRFKNRIELRTQTQRLVAKHIGGTIRAQNDRSRTRRTDEVPSSPAAATLHGKMQGFVLRLPPQNIAHATFMQPFQCNLQPEIQEPHRTTHTDTTTRCKTHIIEGTIRAQNDRSRTRRTNEVPFIAGCSHFTLKNTRFRAPASSPKHSPCNIHAAIPMQFATRDSRTA